jgi:hypothetical protein
MLTLCQPDVVVRNLYRIARAHDENRPMETSEELRNGFLAFLTARQPSVPINTTGDVFVLDQAIQSKLSAAFSKGALNDLNQEDVVGEAYQGDVLETKTSIVRAALNDLLMMDEDFAFVFDLAIHSIFVRPSKPAKMVHGSHGGSSSASIGAIWLAVGDSISRIDLIEMLVHELTHHLLFIDELNHPQFDYQLIKMRENYALSAILKRQRPLDKVVHSIVVGASLVDARRRFLGNHEATVIHPETSGLQKDVVAAIDSVMDMHNVNELLTDHMRSIVDECSEICAQTVLQ